MNRQTPQQLPPLQNSVDKFPRYAFSDCSWNVRTNAIMGEIRCYDAMDVIAPILNRRDPAGYFHRFPWEGQPL